MSRSRRSSWFILELNYNECYTWIYRSCFLCLFLSSLLSMPPESVYESASCKSCYDPESYFTGMILFDILFMLWYCSSKSVSRNSIYSIHYSFYSIDIALTIGDSLFILLFYLISLQFYFLFLRPYSIDFIFWFFYELHSIFHIYYLSCSSFTWISFNPRFLLFLFSINICWLMLISISI